MCIFATSGCPYRYADNSESIGITYSNKAAFYCVSFIERLINIGNHFYNYVLLQLIPDLRMN